MKRLVMVLMLSVSAVSATTGQSVVQPVLRTAPLFSYEDAPATPDADDPAIWINRRNHRQSLIDLDDPDRPLVDITSPDVQRVFPRRYEQPSALQPSGAVEGWIDNPVDDQNAVYGLTVVQGHSPEVFVTARERGLVRHLAVVPAANATLSYRVVRTFLFDTSFTLRNEHGVRYDWTPCREATLEEPQSEGLVVDSVNDTLYAAFETIGLYKLPRVSSLPGLVTVGRERLIEPVKSFGQAYHAIDANTRRKIRRRPAMSSRRDRV